MKVIRDVYTGGQFLKSEREKRHWRQEDVARMLETSKSQVSKLETGALQKPPMADLIAYGALIGQDPNIIAYMFGYYTPVRGLRDSRWNTAEQLVKSLPIEERDGLLETIETLVRMRVARVEFDKEVH